jgi:DNA-binding NtrC family response regulator
MMQPTILIVDDDISFLKAMRLTLEGKYRIVTAGTGKEALAFFERRHPTAVLLDIGLPDISGKEVLQRIRANNPEIPIIMITAIEEVKTIVASIKLGACDYLVKPIDAQQLFLTIRNALENRRLASQIRTIQKPLISKYTFESLGNSPFVQPFIKVARKLAATPDVPVLITGESGSGKGLMARIIHYNCGENPGPFVIINCGAISANLFESELFGYKAGAFTCADRKGKKGLLEEASGGTLFLDEIGVLPLHTQTKLLGVLEDREFFPVGGTAAVELSCRVISATNANLESAVSEGMFRKDLYYRLNVVKLEMRPLRERKEDIVWLAEKFMRQYNVQFDRRFNAISQEAQKAMRDYDWPGNVRELKNLIERIILVEEGDVICADHLPFFIPVPEGDSSADDSTGMAYHQAVRSIIEDALHRTHGNVLAAARLLNLPPHKLRYRIKKLGIRI